MELKEVLSSTRVPAGSGVDGFQRAIGQILKVPRLQEIRISSTGEIQYRHTVREGAEEIRVPEPTYEDLLPYAIIRNSSVVELSIERRRGPLSALSVMFGRIQNEHMSPVAFVGGAGTLFWRWYETEGERLYSDDRLFGLPFYRDRYVSDDALVLCAAFSRSENMQDVRKCFKIALPLPAELTP